MLNAKLIVNYVKNVASCFLTGQDLPKISGLDEKKGVFVTIYKKGDLRGCIGYPAPYFKLSEGLKKATIGAISQDFRFSPVSLSEYNELTFEVTILEDLILLDDKFDFEIGKHGLMIENSGLLLAQVAVENNFTKLQFLQQTCIKAGYAVNYWKEHDVFKFECNIFK